MLVSQLLLLLRLIILMNLHRQLLLILQQCIVDENTGTDLVIYTATADDSADTSGGFTFSLTEDSDAALIIDEISGEVTLSADTDFETQPQYSFGVNCYGCRG